MLFAFDAQVLRLQKHVELLLKVLIAVRVGPMALGLRLPCLDLGEPLIKHGAGVGDGGESRSLRTLAHYVLLTYHRFVEFLLLLIILVHLMRLVARIEAALVLLEELLVLWVLRRLWHALLVF